jgi:hypothetical protein
MTAAPKLTAELLRAIIHYDPDSGDFHWRERPDARRSWNTRYAGKLAGFDWSVNNVAYRSIRIFNYPFLGHRLAWLYMTGAWPLHCIDHKDLDGTNNRWSNLREATKAQNGANTRAPCTNTSGFKGVSLQRKTGRFRAYIKHAGKQKWLGSHDTAESAHAAVSAATAELRGEFGRAA